MRQRRLAVLLGALVLLACGLAAAAPPDGEARARAHYEVGLGMYHLGNYQDAIREFSAGYDLSPRPEFLINLGQAYRKLGKLVEARDMFRRYLDATPATAPDRKQVEQLLAEVERDSAAAPAAPAPPAGGGGAPGRPVEVAAPSSMAVAAPAVAQRPSALRRYWWTIPVAAVVVATALGVGIYFGTPPSQLPCGSATIACVDARH